jgi:hypothetical protein
MPSERDRLTALLNAIFADPQASSIMHPLTREDLADHLLAAGVRLTPGGGAREALREAIGYSDEDSGLEHWHHARGGRTSPDERAGVFVDRQQVLDAIDRVLG